MAQNNQFNRFLDFIFIHPWWLFIKWLSGSPAWCIIVYTAWHTGGYNAEYTGVYTGLESLTSIIY